MSSEILMHEREIASHLMLRHPIDDHRAWTRSSLNAQTAVVKIGASAKQQLAAMAAAFKTNKLPITEQSLDISAWPEIAKLMGKVKALLDMAPGFAVVDSFDLDEVSNETAKAMFWALGGCIGRHVAQRWDGSMLYDVCDTGQTFGYGVRGSHTAVELVFHTDNVSGLSRPDVVSLLCLHPAKEGGLSRFCSLYSLHNRLLEQAPDALKRLYQPILFDRQAEHNVDDAKVLSAPMFQWDGVRLKGRANVNLNRKGYAVAGIIPDAETEAAIAAVERISQDPELWVEAPLKRGQLQFLNNREVAHYRSNFIDFDELEKKRHLVRTWHRDAGSADYDGMTT